jgi:hypothetical protein
LLDHAFTTAVYSHDVLIAEGALAETYSEDGNRILFRNATEYRMLYPHDDGRSARYCAPRLADGELVERVRAQIARRVGLPVAAEATASPGQAGAKPPRRTGSTAPFSAKHSQRRCRHLSALSELATRYLRHRAGNPRSLPLKIASSAVCPPRCARLVLLGLRLGFDTTAASPLFRRDARSTTRQRGAVRDRWCGGVHTVSVFKSWIIAVIVNGARIGAPCHVNDSER